MIDLSMLSLEAAASEVGRILLGHLSQAQGVMLVCSPQGDVTVLALSEIWPTLEDKGQLIPALLKIGWTEEDIETFLCRTETP